MLLEPAALEWALTHIRRFYSSDFFPEPFEFDAIHSQWEEVKQNILNIDLEYYTPETPLVLLAPKANGTFRCVHQLDPIDALIYTALVYSIADAVERNRIPAKDGICCSYRIVPDVNGSFFASNADGWETFTSRTQNLLDKNPEGVVLVCDIVDFYNQIYSHRLHGAIDDLGHLNSRLYADVIERFIMRLSTQTSKGIPVGPAASIVLAEALMTDIDRKILTYTREFVRWVDDIRIFFSSHDDAREFLHAFTQYLYENHRLVLSGEKTQILTVAEFRTIHVNNDKDREGRFLKAKAEAIMLKEYRDELFEDIGPYGHEQDFDEDAYAALVEDFQKNQKFTVASTAYRELLTSECSSETLDYTLIRRVLRNARNYRIRSLLPIVLDNFEVLLPLVREVCLYIHAVLNEKAAKDHVECFRKILSSRYASLPYVNMWLAWILSANAFQAEDYSWSLPYIQSLRGQSLIAVRAKDKVWTRTHKNGLGTLGPYEKRAVLYASQVLTLDEKTAWLSVAKERGGILDRVLAKHMLHISPNEVISQR